MFKKLMMAAVMIGGIGGAAFAKDAPMPVVEQVDLDRYLGLWHEIVRIDQRFQKGCFNSTAEYQKRDDGDIRVINSCDLADKDKRKKATGRAWVVDDDTNAKLKVQFFLRGIKIGFLSGRYWILELGDDYDYVMVGEPSREYLWILARDPELPVETLDMLVAKAKALGYDTSQFLYNRDLVKAAG